MEKIIKEVATFAELDKLIDKHKEDQPQKTALLILKSGCRPYRESGIPKRVAERVVKAAKVGEESLVNVFLEEENEEMFEYHDSLSSKLDKVIEIVFTEEEIDVT